VRHARTFVRTIGTRGAAAITLALLVATGGSTALRAEQDRAKEDNDPIVFTIDVAEDFTRFTPTFVRPEHTQPERGSFFVTEGNIFPGGTIQGDGATFDPNATGAIGKWFCRGTHLVSATEFLTAAIGVHTSQLYLLPNQNKSLSTEGVEGIAPARRPVTGGTGMFRDYVGEMKQELLGFNATGGVNLRVTFVLRKAIR
jgi:hypothetical protein